MPALSAQEAVEAAREVVARCTADEAEAQVDWQADRFVRFAGGGVTQSAEREALQVSIRVRLAAGDGEAGFREARVSCGSLDREAADRAAERAIELARRAPANPELLPLEGAVDVPETGLVRPTLDHGFAEKAVWIRSALAACGARDLAPAGLAQTTSSVRALANSVGRSVSGCASRAAFALTATGGDGSGACERIEADVDRLDAAEVIERAVDTARRAQLPAAAEPGDYTVVLAPRAVSALLLFACYQGFGAREVEEQASFLCDRIDRPAFSELLSLRDEATNEVFPGFPFDGEGTPRSTVPLIERGVLRGPVTDSLYARKLACANTGHALPQPDVHGPMAENLVVAPGELSTEELIGGVDRGIYVSQLHYTNMIEPRDLLLTGMTRNGTFLIEGGRLSGALRNLRFTESLGRALANVTGVGREREVAGALFEGEVVCPALRIDGFRFTSTTDF